MRCLNYCSILLICVLWSIIDARRPSLFDVRIDYYKVETTQDLIINNPRPRFSWKIRVLDNVSQRNVQQTVYQIQIQSIKIIQRDNQFAWDSKRVVSSQSIYVPYTGQNDLLPSTYYRFRVRVWTTNSEEPSEWTNWIQFRTTIFNLHEYLTKNNALLWIGSTKINMNELRKEFMVPNVSPIKSAITYISGIGYYEFYLNGNKVDTSRKLDPGWTSYEKRTLVASFDLTANITAGMNAVGVKLGNGWYSPEQHGKSGYGPPRLIFSLSILFENGNEMQVLSDQTWTGREGSIKHDSIYNGEMYDSRNDRPNWARVGFNDSFSLWIMPESMPSPLNSSLNGSLILQDMLPIRAGPDALNFEVMIDSQQQSYLNHEDIDEIKGAKLTDGGILKPVAMWISDSGLQTFDLGQNIAGWCRLRFRGPSGFGVYIRYGEALTQPVVSTNHSSRNIYTENLKGAAASDTYVLHGDPIGEIYEPTFTIHGFRYLSIFDPPNALTADDVECPFVHSETTLKGHFATSNPIINQIQHNIQWTQLSNLMSVPTDCTERDERRGWLGDAALTVDEALYNFDLIKLYQNFLNLIVDDQLDNGELPNFVPVGNYPSAPYWGPNYPPDPNWASALPTITWKIYRHYSDIQILKDYYDHIIAHIKYFHGLYNTTSLANFTVRYADWVPPSPEPMTNRGLIGSFGFLHDINLLIEMSQVLGKKEDTDTYSILYQKLAKEFHQVFYNTSQNFYADGMQAAQILALALPDVVPANVRDAVLNQLVTDINQKGKHVTTGIVSTARIFPILSDNGHHDLALELISSITYPSYGYMFNNPYENATTLWEFWNSPVSEREVSSRNQAMFGSVGAWFYSHLAGIDLSSNMINIRPRMASETKKHLMSKLDCQLSTLYGLVHVSYTRDKCDTVSNSILLRVTIPPNRRARVMFEPLFVGGQCKTLIESNKIIWSSDVGTVNDQGFDIEKDSTTGLMTVYTGSGQYEFQALW
ncbi:unnamed protein product [Rotaria sordida]|uniref:alpha-L-rhamnosidase n=1 Tax=Rotaria sordida TaxID=392033 RepID=A0A814M0Z8_9BILA|nr:unnamed protein product [Rotaria sordida]CAF1071809.1 unnamed protein product [Rotaria sordida]